MIFKKKSFLAIATMFVASMMLFMVGCSEDETPITGNKFTVSFNSNGGSSVSSREVNENALVTKPADPTKDGHTFAGWYKEAGLNNAWNFSSDRVTSNITLYARWVEAVDIGSSARVYAFDEGGNQTVITTGGPSGNAWSSTEASMSMVLGDGTMTAAFDANAASLVAGGGLAGSYYASIGTPFLDFVNNVAPALDFSGLESIRFKASIKGALFITIESPAVTNWAQWGWKVGEEWSESIDWKDYDVTLLVSEMVGPGWGIGNVSHTVAMQQAQSLVLNLVTSPPFSATRVDFKIDEIWLNFAEGTVPAELGSGSHIVLLDNFERRPNDYGVDDWTNQNALSIRDIENAGTWFAIASDNRPE
jgi:uncharacterized repeat protein (TIGR02543 family)